MLHTYETLTKQVYYSGPIKIVVNLNISLVIPALTRNRKLSSLRQLK